MQDEGEVRRFAQHRNAFGFLRLLLASLVIVGHTPELADGNRAREPLSRLFGTITFGELAVDGFFVISGYLIVGSFVKLPHMVPFLRKRIARIYPAFLFASVVSFGLVAPLIGVSSAMLRAIAVVDVLRMLRLEAPYVPSDLGGGYVALNGAMWSIPYEFRCYLLVLALGMLGAFRRAWVIALLATLCIVGFAVVPRTAWELFDALPKSRYWLGSMVLMVRLAGPFLVGAIFYLWRDRIRFTRTGTAVAAVGLIACLPFPALAEAGVATFGAYLIFACAAWGGGNALGRINNRNDISYGVYLYAWPTTLLVLHYDPQMPLLPLGLLTFGAACVCGWLSWHLLEKPVMQRLS